VEDPRQSRRRNGGRRFLIALSFGAIGLTLAVIVLAGLGTFFIVNSGQAKVVSSTGDLPKELVLCPNFQPSRMVLIDLGKAGKHYRVEGECPVSRAELSGTYVSDLEYAGWTVHTDASGNMTAYRYSSREFVAIVVGQGSSNSNATSVTLDMATGQDVPPDFPPGPSPSPSKSPT
jgi:hypothetical protein